MLDLLIRGGRVFTGEFWFEGDVGVKDGRVALLGRNIEEDAGRIIDAGGMIVIPGGIDGHVHFQMPYGDGFRTADDFYTGTIAAACGGITTIIDFVTPEPGQDIVEAFHRRREEADPLVAIDYGLHVCVTGACRWSPSALRELYREGVTSYKVFTAYSARGLMMDDGVLLRFLEEASRVRALVLGHCENEWIIRDNLERFGREGRLAPIYHALSRPPVAEAESVQRLGLYGLEKGVRILVVHLSSGMGLDAARMVRLMGGEIFVETCPHYLVFTDEVYLREDGLKYIMSPPIKGAKDREALWEGLMDGSIDVVGSDHAPFNWSEKLAGRDDFRKAPGGVQGTENIIPILFSEGVRRGRISLERMVELVALNPAKLYGLYPRKGVIAPGSDADLTIIDPEKEVVLGRDTLHSNLDHSIYEGMKVRGYPVYTVSRGEVIVEDGEPVARKGRGRFLKRGVSQL